MEYGILVAAAAVVLIGGMVAVGAASDAVFDNQAAAASGPANNVLDDGADGGELLDDLAKEDIDVGTLEVEVDSDSPGNTWTVSFVISIDTDDPLPDGTVVPVSGFWEAQSTKNNEDFTPDSIGSCVIDAGECVFSRLFYATGGGKVDEPTVNSVTVVDLKVNGEEFGPLGPATP